MVLASGTLCQPQMTATRALVVYGVEIASLPHHPRMVYIIPAGGEGGWPLDFVYLIGELISHTCQTQRIHYATRFLGINTAPDFQHARTPKRVDSVGPKPATTTTTQRICDTTQPRLTNGLPFNLFVTPFSRRQIRPRM